MSEPAAMGESTGRAAARTVTVTGSGTAEAAPDLLTLAIGVECRRDNAADAFAAAGAASAAVTGAMRSRGVESRDIRTSGLNVRADVVWQEGRGQQVTGYVASSMLSVRLRDLPAGSEVIAAAVEAGGNDVRLDGVQLGFADAAAVLALARDAAWADARAAAAQLAALAGAELGEVVCVRQHPAPSAPVPMGGMQRAFAADSMPVEPGEPAVGTSLTVEWELLMEAARGERGVGGPG
ncbi:SIMPL domain-containing protein [Arthrobacter sp. OAP107]|uniref:SIMPL domain-containing protein n=1 Tax=Arthrobacter sp. OAP107 TaxID=3156445 RepID=UPI0033974344